MQAQITEEKLLSLVEAVQQATGLRPHLSTVIRWCQHARFGIRLESRVVGNRRLTSEQAVNRYVDAITLAKDGVPVAPMPTPRQAVLAAERSAKQLARRLGA